MRLDGRTALITGGTQGVGAAISIALAAAGCQVVLHGLREDELSHQTRRVSPTWSASRVGVC
ncbi:MAG: SDR family NAD(P)-dependent oxidoreductase [Pirellulaceae bacterium]